MSDPITIGSIFFASTTWPSIAAGFLSAVALQAFMPNKFSEPFAETATFAAESPWHLAESASTAWKTRSLEPFTATPALLFGRRLHNASLWCNNTCDEYKCDAATCPYAGYSDKLSLDEGSWQLPARLSSALTIAVSLFLIYKTLGFLRLFFNIFYVFVTGVARRRSLWDTWNEMWNNEVVRAHTRDFVENTLAWPRLIFPDLLPEEWDEYAAEEWGVDMYQSSDPARDDAVASFEYQLLEDPAKLTEVLGDITANPADRTGTEWGKAMEQRIEAKEVPLLRIPEHHRDEVNMPIIRLDQRQLKKCLGLHKAKSKASTPPAGSFEAFFPNLNRNYIDVPWGLYVKRHPKGAHSHGLAIYIHSDTDRSEDAKLWIEVGFVYGGGLTAYKAARMLLSDFWVFAKYAVNRSDFNETYEPGGRGAARCRRYINLPPPGIHPEDILRQGKGVTVVNNVNVTTSQDGTGTVSTSQQHMTGARANAAATPVAGAQPPVAPAASPKQQSRAPAAAAPARLPKHQRRNSTSRLDQLRQDTEAEVLKAVKLAESQGIPLTREGLEAGAGAHLSQNLALTADPDCCAPVVATLACHACAKLARHKLRPEEWLSRFLHPKEVASNGFSALLSAVEGIYTVGTKCDFSKLWKFLTQRLTVGGAPFSELFGCGDIPPHGVPVIATAVFTPGTESQHPHWELFTFPAHYGDPSRYFSHDNGEAGRDLQIPPDGSAFSIWLKPQRRDGCGRVKCKCEERHRLEDPWARCNACANVFYGDCRKPLPPEDFDPRGKKNQTWRCSTCLGNLSPASSSAGSSVSEDSDTASDSSAPETAQVEEAPTTPAPDFSFPAASDEELLSVDKETRRLFNQKKDSDGVIPACAVELMAAADNQLQFSLASYKRSRMKPEEDPSRRQLSGPGLAPVKGSDFLSLRLVEQLSDSAACAIAVKGYAPSTRRFHLADLQKFRAFLLRFKSDLGDVDLPICFLAFLRWSVAASKRWWKAQTLHRKATNLLGALAALPFYSNSAEGLSVKGNREVASFLSRVSQLASQSQPLNQRAATATEIMKAVRKAPTRNLKIAIIVQWFTAARVGDVRGLKKLNLLLEGRDLTVTFTDGKATKLRGGQPYTVHTALPQDMASLLRAHLASLEREDPLVNADKALPDHLLVPKINEVLKATRPGLTTRSLRRGALQAMAMGTADLSPVKLETLMSYAGHKRESTTRRYLDWGRLFGEAAVSERAAAANLAPQV